MFIAWSDADADWVEEIEIVSSFECKYVFNPLGGFVMGKVALTKKQKKMNVHKKKTVVLQHEIYDSNCYKTIFSDTKQIVLYSTTLGCFW